MLLQILTCFARTGVRPQAVLRPVAQLGLMIAATAMLTGRVFAEKAAHTDESWQVVFIQGQRVGYAHSRTWESTADGQSRMWSEVVTAMTIKRFGATLNITVTQLTEEDEQGNLLSFVFETDNPPTSNTKTEGHVDGDKLVLATTAAGRTRTSTQPWNADVKSPAYQDRLLEEDPVQPGQTRTMKIFDPQFLQFATLTIRGESPATTELLDGTSEELNRVILSHSLVPGLVTTIFADAEGETIKTEANLLQMITYTVPRDEALKEIAGAELDLAINTLVKVEPIKRAHRSQRIVYELTLDRPQLPVAIPSGPTQSIERIDENTYHITVTSIQPQEESSETIEENDTQQPVDAKYLGSSRFLECEHPAVVEMAEATATENSNAADVAVAMEQIVHQALTSKNFSTALATAAEVAQTREGDCTEHAVLLAALLRVKKIPSRVVVGLVYAESLQAFGGHMWTEAFLDGRWVPLDATLGRGGIGAGHLKFADSSLADDAPAAISSFMPLVGLLEHISLRVLERE